MNINKVVSDVTIIKWDSINDTPVAAKLWRLSKFPVLVLLYKNLSVASFYLFFKDLNDFSHLHDFNF